MQGKPEQRREERSRRPKALLRALTREEKDWLQRLARSTQEPASQVIHAQQLLAVAAGQGYTRTAESTGRKSGDAVSHLVARFNAEGLQALTPRRRRGRPPTYSRSEREQILVSARRTPDPEQHRTATWSLKLLQRASRRQEAERFGRVSTYTIRAVL